MRSATPEFEFTRDKAGKPVPYPVLSRTDSEGRSVPIYRAWPKQLYFHSVTTPNYLLEGERGTGKSTVLRWDCHLKALSYPSYKYLILRRTMPELRKSHLLFIGKEMEQLGGRALGIRSGNTEAHYPNGSIGLFGHCETEQDIEKYLSAEFYQIVFDEIVTFDWDMITRIGSSCRVPEGSGLTAFLRGGTNPLGISAEKVQRYFIARDIIPDEDPEYLPADWGSLHMTMDDNPSLDKVQYLKRFQGIPEAYRKAWLLGEWNVEGAYFSIEPRHIIDDVPLVDAQNGTEPRPALSWPWIHVYRLLDWGWHDPAACLWIAVLPDGREVPFMEKLWVRTPVQDVAADINRLSEGMKVIATIADPTLWDGEKEMGHCLAFEFEDARISLTKGKNDRTAAGFAIQEHLNGQILDARGNKLGSKLQFVDKLTPTLIRALRAMRVDPKHKGRIADHSMDHLPICLGYFCMSNVAATRIPHADVARPWMRHESTKRRLGYEGVRNPGTSVSA